MARRRDRQPPPPPEDAIRDLLSLEHFVFTALLLIGLFALSEDTKVKTLPLTISLLNLVHAWITGRRTTIEWKLLPVFLVLGLSRRNLKGMDAMLENRVDSARSFLKRPLTLSRPRCRERGGDCRWQRPLARPAG